MGEKHMPGATHPGMGTYGWGGGYALGTPLRGGGHSRPGCDARGGHDAELPVMWSPPGAELSAVLNPTARSSPRCWRPVPGAVAAAGGAGCGHGTAGGRWDAGVFGVGGHWGVFAGTSGLGALGCVWVCWGWGPRGCEWVCPP